MLPDPDRYPVDRDPQHRDQADAGDARSPAQDRDLRPGAFAVLVGCIDEDDEPRAGGEHDAGRGTRLGQRFEPCER
jgi:hypothetical protein